MSDINSLNFDDIQLIADYIDGKVTDSKRKETLVAKLEVEEDFRESYIESYEYLKDIEYTDLYQVPESLKSKAMIKLKPKVKFKVIKNIVQLVKNTIENLKIREVAIEYLSENDTKTISQKFVLDNTLIEISGMDNGIANMNLDTEIGTRITLENISQDLIIIDIKSKEKSIQVKNIIRGIYKITINKKKLYLQID